MQIFVVLSLVVLAACAGLAALRWQDHRKDEEVWTLLRATRTLPVDPFDPAMVADLPEPARRYLTQAILPGTPLNRVVEIDMDGSFGLGTKDDPKYAPMTARQILAGPQGFVWVMRSGAISGSDGLGPTRSWTRFRIFGLVPVARAGGTEDHRRSAFARAVAETVFWSPASVLPGPGITWESIGPDTARLTVMAEGLRQTLDLTVDQDGTPVSMVMPRWSNANPAKVWQVQPFGATFGDLRRVDGFRVPFEVDAGNFFGTDDWFPFFRAKVTDIRFLN